MPAINVAHDDAGSSELGSSSGSCPSHHCCSGAAVAKKNVAARAAVNTGTAADDALHTASPADEMLAAHRGPSKCSNCRAGGGPPSCSSASPAEGVKL